MHDPTTRKTSVHAHARHDVMNEIAILIVNYNCAALTIDCLASLIADPALAGSSRIIVADNASPAGDTIQLQTCIAERGWTDRVVLLPCPQNLGFAYGNNKAIEKADAMFGPSRFYLLLNPDTWVRAGAVSALRAFLEEHPRAGIAGSRLEDPDGTPQACAFRFPSIAGELESAVRFGPITRVLERWRIAPALPDRPCRVDWVSGASLMMRREVVEAVGQLDETYFLYYEELDFCRRAVTAGFECWHVPASRVVHLVGQSTGVTRRDIKRARRPSYWFQSRRHYFVKHHGSAYTLLADLAWIVGQAGFGLRQILSRRANPEPRLIVDFVRHSWLTGG